MLTSCTLRSKILKQNNAMDNNNPVRYSDLISPDDSVEKLVKQLDDLSSSLQFVQKSAVTLKRVNGYYVRSNR